MEPSQPKVGREGYLFDTPRTRPVLGAESSDDTSRIWRPSSFGTRDPCPQERTPRAMALDRRAASMASGSVGENAIAAGRVAWFGGDPFFLV